MERSPCSASSLATLDTHYSADCIEFCPLPELEHFLVCGTYQVLENEGSEGPPEVAVGTEDAGAVPATAPEKRETQRTGRLLLLRIGPDNTIDELQRVDTPAILDAKWFLQPDISGRPLVAVATAKGLVSTYTLDALRLSPLQSIDVSSPSTLCLSLDVSRHCNTSDLPEIIVSLSSGALAVLAPGQNGEEYGVSHEWQAHDYEPWTTAWDNWEDGTLWSGGDDCKLKKWDVKDTSRPLIVNKSFEAGVTTITSSPHTPHLLVVGSYDATLRVFDTRQPLKPVRVIPVGGGVWRARFHPDPKRAGDILVASMHDGFKIVRLEAALLDVSEDDIVPAVEGPGLCVVITRFDAHSSLAYGADWSRLPVTGRDSLISTCSFYDHTMHLWRG